MSTPETSASPLPVLQQPLDEIVREMGFTRVEAIVAVVSCNDTFVSLPTGYGKSVVVSLPAHTYMQWKVMADHRCCCWSFRATNKLELASFVVLRMRFVLMMLFYADSAFLHPPKTWGHAKQNIVRQWTRLFLPP